MLYVDAKQSERVACEVEKKSTLCPRDAVGDVLIDVSVEKAMGVKPLLPSHALHCFPLVYNLPVYQSPRVISKQIMKHTYLYN